MVSFWGGIAAGDGQGGRVYKIRFLRSPFIILFLAATNDYRGDDK